MGIQGLLPLLKSTMVPIHIKELDGCCVAVDTYSWLHKGALSCSTQLCKGLPTSRHIEYCMHRVNLLRHFGVKPILIFDGGLLPMKIEQENKRSRARKENLARAIEHESNGNNGAAYECYQKAVDITPSTAHELIQVLKLENVSYIVAPYEADAQMTFLALSKRVDAVISEDSDLIPFGCPRIIFKMDKYGQGVEFQYSRLQQNKELSFAGFTKQMLLEICILSGCDYLQSLPGMGLKRAHALISKFKSYDKVIKHLKYSTVSVPPLYEESFKKAILTFQHQRVYDPVIEDIVHLSEMSDNLGNDLDFLGPSMPKHIARGIAEGELDPFTQMPFRVMGDSVCSGEMLDITSKFKNYNPESGRKKLDLPVQKNLLTKYFCFASLEAKRKFRAPRMSPLNPSPADNSSLSPKENCSAEDPSCDMNSSLASPFDFENVENTPPNNAVESGFATKVEFSEYQNPEGMMDEKGSSEHSLLQKFGDSINNPHQALLKECDTKHVPSTAQGKTRTETKKVIVRSSYFQHKLANKNDQDNKQERLLVKDDVPSDICKNTILDSSNKTSEVNKIVAVQHKKVNKNYQGNKQEGSLVKYDVASDMCEQTILESSYKTSEVKVIVRSPYFQHVSVNDNDVDNKEGLLEKDDTASDSYLDTILESSISENNIFNGNSVKRKNSPNVPIQSENVEPKHLSTTASFYDNGCCGPSLDETVFGKKTEEGRFGSNISHLSHYSDIAEKSMERFVSVISSFRYSSSGSRASGLRAPLKDIRNICPNRPTAGINFSQFAYIPKKHKTAVASRRC